MKHNINLMDKRDAINFTTNVETRLYKARRNLDFLNKCYEEKVLPNFTKLNPLTITQGKLSPNRITELRQQSLNHAITNEISRIERNTTILNNSLKTLHNYFNTEKSFNLFLNNLRFNVINSQQKNDLACDKK